MEPMPSIRWADFWIVRSTLLPATHPLDHAAHAAAGPAMHLLSDPIVARALETASPSLLSALRERSHGDTSAIYAFVRYIERMRARATPFALLAGYAVVTRHADEPLGVRLVGREEYRHLVRLDADVVTNIVLADARARRDQVRWQVRADLLLFADIVRVVRRAEDDSLTSDDIARTPALDRILELAREPHLTSELAAVLTKQYGSEASLRFVNSLIDAGILVPTTTSALLSPASPAHMHWSRPRRPPAHAVSLRTPTTSTSSRALCARIYPRRAIGPGSSTIS
jgi:hypothetical protein